LVRALARDQRRKAEPPAQTVPNPAE
jgi:hypothetical protein